MPTTTPSSTSLRNNNRRPPQSQPAPNSPTGRVSNPPSTDSGTASATTPSALDSFLAQCPFADATVHGRLSGAPSTKPDCFSRVDAYTSRMGNKIQHFEASFNE